MAVQSGLGADNVYIIINQPQPVLPAGLIVSSGLCAGVASWGPKNVPNSFSTPQYMTKLYGPPINSGRDLVQDGALFLNQFPLGSFIGVRVSDGTDAAAAGILKDSASAAGANATGKYTGTLGNSITIAVAVGSNSVAGALTWKVQVLLNGGVVEQWDRIPGQTGSLAWPAIIAAVNNGQSAFNPASQYVTLALPGTPSTLLPVAQVAAMTGGANGGVPTTSQQLGVDGSGGSRTGIYAGRGTGFDVAWLAGVTDSTSWATLLAFVKSENGYGIGNLPAGTLPGAAVTAVQTAGVSDPQFVICCGTVTYLDTYLNTNVTLPQAPVVAGVACSLPVYEPIGNRAVYGILGTEQTLGANPQPYSAADLSLLESNGILVITAPIPSLNGLGTRYGKNSSSNFATSEISYARQLNAYVRAFQGPVLGQFVNRRQTTAINDPLRLAVTSALNGYLAPQLLAGQIQDYTVVCDLSNNTPASIASGVLNATIIIQLDGIVNQFIVNLTAGQTVSVAAGNNVAV